MSTDDIKEVTKSLGDVVLDASEHQDQDPVKLSAILESFTQAALKSPDPLVREAYIESVVEVLKPRGDELDSGRAAVLKDAALMCVPPLLPHINRLPGPTKEFLDLIAQYSDPREVTIVLNEEIGRLTEQSDPYVVSDGEGDDEMVELDWTKAFPELEQILDMYATGEYIPLARLTEAIPRLQNRRSTPTLLALQDTLVPLFKAIPNTAPQEMAMDMSRSLLKHVSNLVDAAWKWSQTTSDYNGEPKAMLIELLQTAIMIFGASVGADLTARWYLTMNPRYAGLHQDEAANGLEGQKALDAAIATCRNLGVDETDLCDRVTNASSVKPYSSLASIIILAANLPPLHGKVEDFAPNKDFFEDAMPVLNNAINGSAVDAGTAMTWALVDSAQKGLVTLENDQSFFLLELIMPHVQTNTSPSTRLALMKLLGGVIAATPGTDNQIELWKQLLEPFNPFEAVRVQSVSLLREQLASPPQPSPLFCAEFRQQLGPILFEIPTIPENPLSLSFQEFVSSMYAAWFTECCNLLYFIVERDAANASGIRDKAFLSEVKAKFLAPISSRMTEFKADITPELREKEPEVELVIDRVAAAAERASEGIDKAIA